MHGKQLNTQTHSRYWSQLSQVDEILFAATLLEASLSAWSWPTNWSIGVYSSKTSTSFLSQSLVCGLSDSSQPSMRHSHSCALGFFALALTEPQRKASKSSLGRDDVLSRRKRGSRDLHFGAHLNSSLDLCCCFYQGGWLFQWYVWN